MYTVAATGSASIASLRGVLESLQALWPEVGQEAAQRGERLRAAHVKATLTLGLDRDEPRLLEDLEVLRDGLLGDIELRRDLVDRARLVPHQAQDVAPARLGQRLQGGLTHARQCNRRSRLAL